MKTINDTIGQSPKSQNNIYIYIYIYNEMRTRISLNL
jgi:hypothetical protein